jgi:ABC-type branched-subunit amino acid transport system substrate-binding protein
MAIDEINQKGGVLGAPLKMLARDHGANSATGRANLEYFAANPAVVAVMGGMHSAVITDELPDIHRLQMPYLIPWAAAQGLILHEHRPSFTFRVSINDSHVAPFLLEHALKLNGPVTALLERSAWGRSNEAALQPLLEKLPKGTVEIDWINTGDTTIDLKVDQVIKAGKRSIVLVANGIEAGAIVRAMAKQEKPIPIFAHWALSGSDFWGLNQTVLQKVDLRFVQSILMNETTPRSLAHPLLAAYLARYRKRFGLSSEDPIPSLIGSVHAYDFTHLLARSIAQAKSTDRVAIRNALESPRPYSGILREFNPAFTKDRHDALDRSLLHLARFDTQGRIVLAE